MLNVTFMVLNNNSCYTWKYDKIKSKTITYGNVENYNAVFGHTHDFSLWIFILY